MQIGRRSLGWGRVVPVLILVSALIVPTAALGSGSRVQQRTDARTVVHAGGAFSTTGRYRSSLQGPLGTPRPPATSSAGITPAHASSAAPTFVQGFLGIPDVDLAEPADTTGSLGVSYFLTAVNTSYALWNRDGTQAIAPTPLTDLTSQDDGLIVFDPKVVYDGYTDTFVMMYLAQRDSSRSSLIVLTSIPDATATDPSTWCTTSLQGDQIPSDQPTWADYSTLGFDQDRVTISTNEFTFPSTVGRFAYAQVISFPKSSLYDCTATPVGTVFAGTDTANPDGSKAFTIQPAQTVGAAGAQFMLSFHGPGKRSFLTVWRIRASATGLRLTKASMGVGRVRDNVVGSQGGGSPTSLETAWDAGDQRLINAWYDGDRKQLFAAHNVGKDLVPDTVTGGYLESVIGWYEVDPAGKKLRGSTVARKGIVGTPETDAGWPVVATDGSGNLFITYSRASEPLNEYLSAWAAEIPAGSTTASLLELVPGTAVHDAINGLERWGDYNGIDRDPADPSRIAMINQIAVPNSEWQQTVNVVTGA